MHYISLQVWRRKSWQPLSRRNAKSLSDGTRVWQTICTGWQPQLQMVMGIWCGRSGSLWKTTSTMFMRATTDSSLLVPMRSLRGTSSCLPSSRLPKLKRSTALSTTLHQRWCHFPTMECTAGKYFCILNFVIVYIFCLRALYLFLSLKRLMIAALLMKILQDPVPGQKRGMYSTRFHFPSLNRENILCGRKMWKQHTISPCVPFTLLWVNKKLTM